MYETIPIQRLDQWLEQGYEGRIIDLRIPQLYQSGHLWGAENIPYEELEQEPSLIDGPGPFLFYCSRGSESLLVCNYYSRQGMEVYNVAGGYIWYKGKYGTAKEH